MDTVVDNDLILKSVCFGLADTFWPTGESSLGVLGAVRYVVPHAIDRAPPRRGSDAAQSDLNDLLLRCEELEPTEEEVTLAAEVELCGQEHGFALDNGESQLAAIVILRGIALLETGDKRAIAGLEGARSYIETLHGLRRRVRCLEQIARRLAQSNEYFERISTSVCAESGVDKSLSICFGCFSDTPADQATALEALNQYVQAIRRSAPEVLVDGD